MTQKVGNTRNCLYCSCPLRHRRSDAVICEKQECLLRKAQDNYKVRLALKPCITCQENFKGTRQQRVCTKCEAPPHTLQKVQQVVYCVSCNQIIETREKNLSRTYKVAFARCESCSTTAKKKFSESRRGAGNPNWKGGRPKPLKPTHMLRNQAPKSPPGSIRPEKTNPPKITVWKWRHDFSSAAQTITRINLTRHKEPAFEWRHGCCLSSKEHCEHIQPRKCFAKRLPRSKCLYPNRYHWARKGRAKYIGPKHWRWKGNRAPSFTLRTRLSSWVRKVMDRDGYQCTNCHAKGYLEVHHLKPFRDIVDEVLKAMSLTRLADLDTSSATFEAVCKSVIAKHTLEIGVTLCKRCHAEVDKLRRI